MKIGIAGTGRMGTAIAQRLLENGHEVRVWNRSVDNAHEAREAGARWTPTLGELVGESEVVITFLFDNTAVEHVYLGADGLLSGPAEGRLFIDMSTVSPGTHSRVAPVMAARNADFIECPVSGSVAAARSGTLVGFAGGESFAFARAQPCLRNFVVASSASGRSAPGHDEACRKSAAGDLLASARRIHLIGRPPRRERRTRDRPSRGLEYRCSGPASAGFTSHRRVGREDVRNGGI